MRSTFVALLPSLSEEKRPALHNCSRKNNKDPRKYPKEGVLCRHQPIRVQINAFFLVDLRSLPLNDLQADDNGSYEHIGSPKETFCLNFESGVSRICKRISRKKMKGTNRYLLTRKYHKSASSPDLKRTTSYRTTPSGDILGNIAIIQYNFTEQVHTFAVQSHGNAKKNKVPYTRTQDSTKPLLRSNLTKATPKQAFQKTTIYLGGTLNAKSTGSTPRNRKQAYNMK